MNLEKIKTFILTFLVLLSILLTFGLWNYQPNYDHLYNSAPDYVNEADIDGDELMKSDVIQPSQVIFHTENGHLGFKNVIDQQNLYTEMQTWNLYDFTTGNVTFQTKKDKEVEIIFPIAIPLNMTRTLLKFHEEFSTDDIFPSWSFNRILITFNENESTLTVTFPSIDGREHATATINNSNVYNKLMSYIIGEGSLTEYVAFDEKATQPIYVQAKPVEMVRRSLSVEHIEPSILVDALFSNPTLVSHNIRESSFSDGQRALRILQDGQRMEYYNPIESSNNQMDGFDLLSKSIESINDHKGWTEEYHLTLIDPLKSKVRFQMYYGGYPIFNRTELSFIEQEWKDDELHFYRRSLFLLNDSLDGETITLHSGTEVIYFLKNNSNLDSEKIKDIQIGYKLSPLEGASYSVELDPVWYVNYDNNWLEIRFEELEQFEKGGG